MSIPMNGMNGISKENDRTHTLYGIARGLQTILHPHTKISAVDNASVEKRKLYYGYIHAVMMMFCFCVLMATIYTQQQPYRYTSSRTSLLHAVRSDQAKAATTVDDIWQWVNDVTTGIGGKTVDHINANCRYPSPNYQEVEIDGVRYSLLNPSVNTNACSDGSIGYIKGDDEAVFLTGNHMILSFGIFTERSVPKFPVKKSVKSDNDIKVRSSTIEPLNPTKDDKIIETCTPPWGSYCLHKDGFRGEAGSTFGWDGQVIDGTYAYRLDSSVVLFSNANGPQEVKPCYAYTDSSTEDEKKPPDMTVAPTPSPTPSGTPPGPPGSRSSLATLSRTLSDRVSEQESLVLLPGNSSYTGNVDDIELTDCSYRWVSSSYDIRVACLNLADIQPSAIFGYLARIAGFNDVAELYNVYFGCVKLTSFPVNAMDTTFVEARKTLDSYLVGEQSYGLFFSTTNQEEWIEDSAQGTLLLREHNFIDKNTRIFRVYIVTRNLGNEDLFYTMIRVQFNIRTDGAISATVDTTFVPMIQFFYGYDGYEWRTTEVFVLEVMLLIVFTLFTLREIYQLITRRLIRVIPCVKRACKGSVHPTDPCDNVKSAKCCDVTPINDEEIRSVDHNVARSVPGGIETGLLGGDLNNMPHNTTKPERTKSNTDIADKLDDLVDDIGEAIEDIFDDILPDQAGMHDILDWVTIVVISVGIVYRVRYITSGAALHNTFLKLEGSSDLDDHLESILEDFRHISSIGETLHLIAIAAMFAGMIQFFRYLSFDRKLGIVTATITGSASDLLPVLLIFVVIAVAYGVLGTEIYGSELSEWSNLGYSLASLFIMMLGEYGEYYRLREVSPVETAIFFWSFVVIISFILLNMVLAVIFTVYDEKYQEIKLAESAAKKKNQ
mmetsp:Transcript_21112/g.30520  ORF Transcript_21112/g.30520 Transcript_21112/m.30520 type:complete len:889 (-) Transcript_21112:159-2825(-)